MDWEMWRNAGARYPASETSVLDIFRSKASLKVDRFSVCTYRRHKWVKVHIVAESQPFDPQGDIGFHLWRRDTYNNVVSTAGRNTWLGSVGEVLFTFPPVWNCPRFRWSVVFIYIPFKYNIMSES